MILAVTLTIALLTSAPINRCFVSGSPKQELARSTAVFVGKVIKQERVVEELPSGEVVERLVVRISVAHVWKGDIYSDVTLYTSKVFLPNGLETINSEDFHFKDDKEYLVYAFGKADRLRTDACTRTRELSDADDDLKELGEGRVPKTRDSIEPTL